MEQSQNWQAAEMPTWTVGIGNLKKNSNNNDNFCSYLSK